jgi:uncharacterized protein YbjT (DUF2867 family)
MPTLAFDTSPENSEFASSAPQNFHISKLSQLNTMAKILAIFGATGQQGSSIVTHVLNDPQLSKEYKIRAITRDTTTSKSLQLAQKVEVVQGDVLDRASLEKALEGVHTVFAMTTPTFGPSAFETEYESGKRIADVAVAKGVEYLIFSTLPAVKSISGGKYTKITPFDSKAAVEAHIRTLPIKSSFYSPSSFMENFQAQGFLAPQLVEDGSYVMSRNVPASANMPLIDAVGDTGKFIGAILADPEKYEGKSFCGASGFYTNQELVDIMSKATGKKVVYKEVSTEEFKKSLEFLPANLLDIFTEAFLFGGEFGYWGAGSEEAMKWSIENARGKLSTLEEYLERHPLVLA